MAENTELSVEIDHFIQWFRKATPDTHRNLFFHLYWEQVFQCRLNSTILTKFMPQRPHYKTPCTGDERFDIDKGIYMDEGAFRGIILGMKTLTTSLPIMEKIIPLDCSKPVPESFISEEKCRECIWKHRSCVMHILNGAIAQLNTINRQILYPEASQNLKRGEPVLDASFLITNFKYLNGRYQAVPIGNWTLAYHAEEFKFNLPRWSIRENQPVLKLDSHLVFWRSSSHGIVEAGIKSNFLICYMTVF